MGSWGLSQASSCSGSHGKFTTFLLSVIQTLIFLKLAVAGHLTIYLARTGQQHFWERPFPSFALFGTAEITQVGATLIAVYGIFMTPIGWSLALIVWGYALVSFLINDQIKVWLFKKIHPYS